MYNFKLINLETNDVKGKKINVQYWNFGKRRRDLI